MEDKELKDIKKKIFQQTNEAINYHNNCSYLKRKIEENMRGYNIIRFDERRKKRAISRSKNKSYTIKNFDKGLKTVNRKDSNENISQKQNDDDILSL